MYACKNAG